MAQTMTDANAHSATRKAASRGSSWYKWDLHVHTPKSIVHEYKDIDAWGRFVSELQALPSDIRVLGINDYIFLEGYELLLEEKKKGKLPNIDLLLPVIELRLDKFGGSKNSLSRVNYHVIFSDAVDIDVIQTQFLSRLYTKYVLTPRYDHLREAGVWAATPTRKSLEDLGRQIIASVPPQEARQFSSPIQEGFSNLCFSLETITDILRSPIFKNSTITAVGKTEWADIKWNDHSIADKKTIINAADAVFISVDSEDDFHKAQKSLVDARVNDRLLDCSDAHHFAGMSQKDRLGNCLTWIKAEPTFEGLRQALLEYNSRVKISAFPAIEPVYQIRKVALRFPDDTQLRNDKQTDKFCFAGEHEFSFSPFYTCLIGGRGTGKSTLLSLISEKLQPGSTLLFEKARLFPASVTINDGVIIDGIAEPGLVEFLQQNEIEQFASDNNRLTDAIFSRLRKLDDTGALSQQQMIVKNAGVVVEAQISKVLEVYRVLGQLSSKQQELNTQIGIVQSIQSEEYKQLNIGLKQLTDSLGMLVSDQDSLRKLLDALSLAVSGADSGEPRLRDNSFRRRILEIVKAVSAAIKDAENDTSLNAAQAEINHMKEEVRRLRLQLSEYLSRRGLSKESLADVGGAAERIVQLEQEVASLQKEIAAAKKDLEQFSSQVSAAEKFRLVVEGLLAPINQELASLGTEVKPIELLYYFDEEAFTASMIEFIINGMRSMAGGAKAMRQDYVMARLQNIDFLALSTLDAMLASIPHDETLTGTELRAFLSAEPNFEVLRLTAERKRLDVASFGKIHVRYDEKPVESSSFGQRCTAAIVILLLLGNTPLVIDEPEAHLDSALIAKYLVHLVKRKKQHRQIIFATHNANFVINGDADLIQCLYMGDSKVTGSTSTTIEDLTHRNLLLSLEGGEEAFRLRETRYGMS